MILAKADMFGYSLEPTFKGESRIKTVLGGIISILLSSFFTFAFFYVGKEIIDKKNPISNISAIRIEDAPIPLKNIPIILALISYDGRFLHLNDDFNRAAQLYAGFYEVKTSESGQVIYESYNLPFTFCTRELLGEEYYDIVKNTQAGLEYALCLDYPNLIGVDGSKHPGTEPSIRNPFGAENSAHINIGLVLCDEQLDPGCRKGIESVGTFNFVVSVPQDILNISSNESPIFTEMKSLSTNTFLGLSFNQVVNFNINELVSDDGWILEENSFQTFFTSDAPIYNTTQYSESDRIIGRFILSANLVKNVVNRRYMKLQELVANLGGFMKVVMTVFSVLLRNYSKWNLYTQVVRTRTRPTTVNLNSSKTIINNLVVANVVDKGNIQKAPSFIQFVFSMFNSNYARNHKINWEECFKYLDLLHIKNQFEILDSLARIDNTNK